MSDRSFLECWSLNFDDMELVEGFNLNSRIWVPFNSGSSGHMDVFLPAVTISARKAFSIWAANWT